MDRVTSRPKRRLAVFLSGRGSNFVAIAEAIAQGEIEAEIVLVLSNRPGAPGIMRAAAMGLHTMTLDHRDYPSREEHERAVLSACVETDVELIALAGYMRLIGPTLLVPYRQRILNIHPSLLPSFPGVDAQRQALEHGVRVAGCTVHFVDEELDGGPILVQKCVEVLEGDTVESLSERILTLEHRAYIEALATVCRGYRIEGRRVKAGPQIA